MSFNTTLNNFQFCWEVSFIDLVAVVDRKYHKLLKVVDKHDRKTFVATTPRHGMEQKGKMMVNAYKSN